jgi:hypothetical protein
MTTKCMISESKYEITDRKLFVESCGSYSNDVILTIDNIKIRVNADELIKAVQNCKNS